MNLEEVKRNPSDVTLDHIVKDLLSFFNGFECLHEAKRMIEMKCAIKKEPEHKCWPEDKIKQAWEETIKEDIKSSKRKHWARVIMLQVVKSSVCDTCKQNTAQKNRNATTDEQGCDLRRNPEDGSSQSKAEPETVGAAGGHEQIKGEDLTQRGEQLSSSDLPEEVEADLENVQGKAEDDVWITDDNKQACGTEQIMTVKIQDRSTQSSTELNKKKKQKNPATKPVYIRIPFSEMFGKVPSSRADNSVRSLYKLVDRVPSYAGSVPSEIRKRKSYIMSYNRETNNADWVYEILNKSILENKCKEQMSFGKNELENKDCNQGHLAAVANHRWCQEAYHDTFLMSNMIPQNKSLNNDMWSTLEKYCRDFVKGDTVRNVHVYTGPFYPEKKKKRNERVKLKPNEINPLKVKAVPTHFFKVIIVENKDGTVEEPECYVMANEKPEHEGKLDEDKGSNKEAKLVKELLKKFKVNIDKFDEEYPFKFIERNTKYDVLIKTMVKLTGEDGNGESHSIDIDVIYTPSNT